jgi:hypothetical protein
MVSSGMLRHVALVGTDFSEELSASFIRVTRIDELGTALGVTSNRRTLRRNLVPTFADRGVSRGQRGGSPTVVFSKPEPLIFIQVAPYLSSQGLSGPRSRSTATQKIW